MRNVFTSTRTCELFVVLGANPTRVSPHLTEKRRETLSLPVVLWGCGVRGRRIRRSGTGRGRVRTRLRPPVYPRGPPPPVLSYGGPTLCYRLLPRPVGGVPTRGVDRGPPAASITLWSVDRDTVLRGLLPFLPPFGRPVGTRGWPPSRVIPDKQRRSSDLWTQRPSDRTVTRGPGPPGVTSGVDRGDCRGIEERGMSRVGPDP